MQKQSFAGIHRIYWTPTAVRLDCEQGYSFVSKAPFTKVVNFRLDDNVYLEATIPEFYNFYQYTPAINGRKNKGFLKIETIEKDGLSISKYRFTMGNQGVAQIWVVDTPPAALEISDIVQCYYRLPPTSGIVYRVCRDKVNTSVVKPEKIGGFLAK